MRASVARCPRTPPDAAKTPGLQIGISNRITRLEQPEHSCRLQLWIGPITAEPCRAKARPLRPRRSYFDPVSGARTTEVIRAPNWWSRRVPPPGPKGLLRRPFIAISGLRRRTQYRREILPKKERAPGGRRRRVAARSDLDGQSLKACRAKSLQRASCRTQTCSTPILAVAALPAFSYSTAATWRTIALPAAITVVGSVRVMDL